MPLTLANPPAVTSVARHAVRLSFALPIGGELTCTVDFTRRTTRADASTEDAPDGSVTLSQAEIAALPAFTDAYAQLSAAVHAKRSTYDPQP